MRFLSAAFIFVLLFAGGVARAQQAQTVISIYGGIQEPLDSRVTGNDPSPGGAGAFSFIAAWEGRSLQMSPYYGWRVTRWTNGPFGWGVEFTHEKAEASAATLAANGLNMLEFTHGLNLLTLNVYYRWPETRGRLTPYVGAGAGVSIPHVEFDAGGSRTYNIQMGGPAAVVMAGASYRLNDRLSVFGEYRASYTSLDVELAGGGWLRTDIASSAFNLGVSYGF